MSKKSIFDSPEPTNLTELWCAVNARLKEIEFARHFVKSGERTSAVLETARFDLTVLLYETMSNANTAVFSHALNRYNKVLEYLEKLKGTLEKGQLYDTGRHSD